MIRKNLPVPENRPGWTMLLETLEDRLETRVRRKTGNARIASATVHSGLLSVEIEDATPFDLGAAAAAANLSGEICDKCGRKGNPVAPAGTPTGTEPTATGCRCERCQTPDTVVVTRSWTTPDAREPKPSVSPGQWTQDLRGTGPGTDWDITDWRNYGRLEDQYRKSIERLMAATDDEKAMMLWAGRAGWAGLIRALFLTLRTEQDERPDDPNHVPWRLRYIKEKWGCLDVRTTRTTPYQFGAALMIEALSAHTCLHCGNPGRIRRAGWVRPECDECWERASPEEKAEDAKSSSR